MKTLIFSVITLSLLAFTFKKNSNHADLSSCKFVKQTIRYNDGNILTTKININDLEKPIFSKNDSKVVVCTYETPSGGCSKTAATCSKAFDAFVDCLCSEGYKKWCQFAPDPTPVGETQ
jgi:hypothetical protein